jgi:hypothetical protein
MPDVDLLDELLSNTTLGVKAGTANIKSLLMLWLLVI